MHGTSPLIDYRKMADAQTHYAAHDYQEVAVPWIIERDAYLVTHPAGKDVRDFYTLGGYLNGSGEQSFIQMLMDDEKLGRACCVTPCFRDARAYDELHHPYFVKLELIDTTASQDNLRRMIASARTYFDGYFHADVPTRIVPRSNEGVDACDLVDGLHSIELGSYGIRTHNGFRWVYGTGVALPRLSAVLAHHEREGYVREHS